MVDCEKGLPLLMCELFLWGNHRCIHMRRIQFLSSIYSIVHTVSTNSLVISQLRNHCISLFIAIGNHFLGTFPECANESHRVAGTLSPMELGHTSNKLTPSRKNAAISNWIFSGT